MASQNNIFFDANLLLSILLDRSNRGLVERLQDKHGNDKIYISTLTGHLVAHFRPEDIELGVAEQFLNDYEMLPVSSDDFAWAFDSIRDDDFEDALQLSVALRNGCSVFYTFDKQLVANYKNLPTLQVKLLC